MRIRIFVYLFFLNIVALSAQDTFLKAWIDVQSENDQRKIEAKFVSKLQNERTFTYKLITEKSGNNTSSNTQSGEFTAAPDQELILSNTQINITSQDYFKALLQIYFNRNLIAQDSIEIGTKKVSKPKVITKVAPTQKKALSSYSDNLEIDGLIIDETRSKVARDFYDFFYNKWIAPPGAKDFAISIKELPSRGRVARVTVEVNDKALFTRVLQPRLDMVEQMANQAIRIVRKHLGENESLKKDLDESDTKGSGLF